MKKTVEIIARALVDKPEDVAIIETESDEEILLELSVHPDDMGKVIGESGKIAKAIRSVVKAASAKLDKKVVLEIK